MLSLHEALRRFWLPGLYQISKRPTMGLADWLIEQEFVITDVVDGNDFKIRSLNPEKTLDAFAFDASKMSSAAFETAISAKEVDRLPKSCAWLAITTYYGAFFAAHSLLRMFGVSLTQLDHSHQNVFRKVADLFGVAPQVQFSGGYFIATHLGLSNEIHFVRSSAQGDGSHGVLWRKFGELLTNCSNTLFSDSIEYNESANFLNDLKQLMSQGGQNGGTWLSHMRNGINYKMSQGAWHPYSKLKIQAKDLTVIIKKWETEPLNLRILYPSNDLLQHVGLCVAIISMCHAVAEDIMKAGRSQRGFFVFGPMALKAMASKSK